MKHQPPPAAATSIASADANIPTYEELLADPEIAALIGFAPVPRRNKKEGGWSAGMQRMFIARLARHGSPGKACDELGMYRSGVDKLFKSAGADSFRAAWAAAVALAEQRRAEHVAAGHASVADLRMPFVDNRRGRGGQGPAARAEAAPLPGQMRNEHGGYEDAESLARRAEEAGESIARKLLRIRRLYLQEISDSPGKRAAFEILTELPIDWDKAARGEAQADEPYRTSDQREPDMVLLAESGWSWGEVGYGPDRKAEARKAVDQYREEEGLPAINWDEEEG